MPIYEYHCEAGHDFEILQKMSDPPLENCTICSAKAWRKISLCNQPKGAGIYLFDRRYGDSDILSDSTLSDREKREIISSP